MVLVLVVVQRRKKIIEKKNEKIIQIGMYPPSRSTAKGTGKATRWSRGVADGDLLVPPASFYGGEKREKEVGND